MNDAYFSSTAISDETEEQDRFPGKGVVLS